jgi:hypothetical protein
MDNSILWPAAMTIMAGIDLLAKFETGENRDTSCIPDRPPFREEKELLATA